LPAGSVGAFVQGSFRGNLVYIGLSVIIYGSSTGQMVGNLDVQVAAILAFAIIVPAYNVMAVVVLLLDQQRANQNTISRMIKEIKANFVNDNSKATFRWCNKFVRNGTRGKIVKNSQDATFRRVQTCSQILI